MQCVRLDAHACEVNGRKCYVPAIETFAIKLTSPSSNSLQLVCNLRAGCVVKQRREHIENTFLRRFKLFTRLYVLCMKYVFGAELEGSRTGR
jgi:hypothetical protein